MMTSLLFRSFGLCFWKRLFSFSKPKPCLRIKDISVKEIGDKKNDDDTIEIVHSPWDKLPCDLWGLIFQRLQLVDRIHASLVSKEWSSTLKQTFQPVWMLLPSDYINKDCDDVISFFDLSEGTIGKLKLPKSIMAGASPLGISKGWLAFTKGAENNLQPFLFDPISRVKIPLPPLPTIIPSNLKGAAVFDQIEISSKEASQSVVAASLDEGKTLALCRPTDKKWTIFEGLADNYEYSFGSISFCDGILYAFIETEDDETPFQFHHSMKLAAGGDDVILKLIPLASFVDIGPPIFLPHPLEEVDLFAKNWMAIPYMVESNGDLLIVVKILDVLTTEDDSDESDTDDLPPLLSYFRVARFEVFKVEVSDALRVTRLSNLDDQTLFIDGQDSKSIAAGENFNKNCIYFVEDTGGYNVDGWKKNIISRESGVFHLNDGKIERWFPSLDLERQIPNVWFFPDIKIGGYFN